MAKIMWKPGTMVYPAPAALISCGSVDKGNANMLTIAWIGTICTNPAMLSISIRPERHSYNIIRDEMQFTVNLTTEELLRATDWCGVRSGSECDKFKETGLTPAPGIANTCCMIAESPLSIECRVKTIMHLGSHDMFIAEVLNVVADDRYFDEKTGYFDLGKAKLTAYCHGRYYGLGEMLGTFGFSVKKSKNKRKSK